MTRTLVIRGRTVEGLVVALYARTQWRGVVDRVVRLRSDHDAADSGGSVVVPPDARALLARIGLDEELLFRRADAAFLVGREIDGAKRGILAWSRFGAPANSVPFHQYWTRLEREGLAGRYDDYSFGAQLARQGRFIHPSADPKKLEASFDYGYVLDHDDFLSLLLERAAAAGVEEALRAPDEAWLAIDTRPPAGDCRFEAWPDMPARCTIEISRTERAGANLSSSVAALTPVDLTVETRSRSSCHLDKRHFQTEEGDRIGRLKAPWNGRSVALGKASVRLAGVTSAGFMLFCRQLELLASLLPADGMDVDIAAREFNRRAGRMADHLADHEALCLSLFSGGDAGGFVSPALRRRVEQFRSRGRVVTFDDDPVDEQDWITSMILGGLSMDRVSPLAASAPLDAVEQSYEKLRQVIARGVSQLPEQQVYLQHLLASGGETHAV